MWTMLAFSIGISIGHLYSIPGFASEEECKQAMKKVADMKDHSFHFFCVSTSAEKNK